MEQINATKNKLQEPEALQLLAKAHKLYAAKGKKVVQVNLKKDRPDDETLTKLVLGPTGNLRAPTLRAGKTLLVGFHEETYQEVLT